MLEDKILLWKFKLGSGEALARLYDKYERYLLTVACGLVNDVHAAEDILQDFFVSLAAGPEKVSLNGNFKAYMATCVANLTKNSLKRRAIAPASLSDEQTETCTSNTPCPAQTAISNELTAAINEALAKLPYEQREVVILHFYAGLKFTQIAKASDTSVNTIQSRYRYGMEKLRSLLDSEVIK